MELGELIAKSRQKRLIFPARAAAERVGASPSSRFVSETRAEALRNSTVNGKAFGVRGAAVTSLGLRRLLPRVLLGPWEQKSSGAGSPVSADRLSSSSLLPVAIAASSPGAQRGREA